MTSVFVLPGEMEEVDKFSKRLVRVTRQHNDECKQLLKLMGIPYVEVRLEAPDGVELTLAVIVLGLL